MSNRIHIDKPMHRSLRWGSFILVVIVLVGAVAYQFHGTADSEKVAPNAPAFRHSAMPVEQHSPARVDIAVPLAFANETRTQQFDRLARGTPEEALQALKLLQPCEDADHIALELAAPTSDNDDPTFRSQQNAKIAAKVKALSTSCEGLTAGQRTQSIPLAIKAAQAGIPGAFEALTRQESWSAINGNDLRGDPRDPRIIQAMPAILDAYVNAGDPSAILARYQHVSNCPDAATCTGYDPRASLVLWTMYVDSGSLKSTDTLTANWVKVLGPDVAQTAISEGHAAYATRGAK